MACKPGSALIVLTDEFEPGALYSYEFTVAEAEDTPGSDSSSGGETVAVTVDPPASAALSDDASLSALSLSGVDIGTFDADTTAYSADVAATAESTTITATPNDSGAVVTVTPDDDSIADGHQIDLEHGANVITVTVESADGTAERAYQVVVNRASSASVWGVLPDHKLFAPDNSAARAIWSDGETIWVTNLGGYLYAYNLADMTRDASKDISALGSAGNHHANGVWSDGTTVWVSDDNDVKIYAYDLHTGDRKADADLDGLLAAGNDSPKGLWSDGATMWVADHSDDMIYAYDLHTGDRRSGQDITGLGSADNGRAAALWSDGTVMWVSDDNDAKIYAYDLHTGDRKADLDLDGLLAAGNPSPKGIWSDGTTMWVADPSGDRLHAYDMPETAAVVVVVGEEAVVVVPLWSATLTVGGVESAVGFDLFTGLGGLSSRSFSFGDWAGFWVVGSIYVYEDGHLYFVVSDPGLPAFTLDVGGFRFSSRDAEVTVTDSLYRYWWPAGELTLSVGDEVNVSLVQSDSAQDEPQPAARQAAEPDSGQAVSEEAIVPEAATALPLVTASAEGVPDSHSGSGEFAFELRFSEEFPLSYRVLKDHAFMVTGGTIAKAQRLERGSNIGWRISVRPGGNGDVTVVLPAATDCDARGAVCTADARKLSNRLEITVSGPGQ